MSRYQTATRSAALYKPINCAVPRGSSEGRGLYPRLPQACLTKYEPGSNRCSRFDWSSNRDRLFAMFGRHCLQCCREVGREAIFRQQMCERRRAIEIDHRSARSRCRWLRSSSIFIPGLRAGGPRPTEIGGVIQPCRRASNSSASDPIELLVGPGGPSLAH
jgi:hypothetical protein